MDWDLTHILLYFFGIALVVLLAIFGAAVNQLQGIRIQRPSFQLKDESDIPDHLLELYQGVIAQLSELGFEIHHYQLAYDIIVHEHAEKWSVVMVNRDTSVLAEISPSSSFLYLPGPEVDFWSIGKDGSALITINGRGHTLLCNIPGAEFHDPMVATLEEQYQAHRDEQQEVFKNKPLVIPNAAIYLKLQQKLINDYFLNLLKEGGVVSTGQNQFRLTMRKTLSLVKQLLHGEKRLRKLLREKFSKKAQEKNQAIDNEDVITDSSVTTAYPAEAEVQAYLRLRSAQQRTPAGMFGKLTVFVFTLILSYFAFGLVFSFNSVLILLGVILFHELGHIAAMYAFKYRDLQILFIPLMGAAATGNKEDVALWKQVIVYLMGPLPGILVGIGLIAMYQYYQSPWLYETAIIMLVINYLNLLPFVPLDGGHIIRLTIMERFPTGKLMFSALSGLAFAAGGWFFGEPVFWVLAVIMFTSLPWSALEAGVLNELFDPSKNFEDLDKESKLRKLFETLKQPKFYKMQFAEKYNLVKSLSEVVLHKKHLGRLASLGLNGIYLGALLLTPVAVMVTAVGMENVANVVTLMSGEVPKKDWDRDIAEAESSEKRFELMLAAAQFYTATNEAERALSYLEQAEKTFAAINTDSALARLYQAYSYYYQRHNDLSRAEEYLIKVIMLHKQLPDQHAMQLATNYQSLANLRQRQNKLDELETDLKTGLTYALKVKNPEERFIISTVVSLLLDHYYSKKELDKVQTLLVDTLPLLEEYSDPFNRFVASYLHQELGWLYSETRNIGLAMEHFDQALQLSSVSSNQEDSDFSDPLVKVNIYLAMAAAQYRNGNLAIAESRMNEAAQLAIANHFQSLDQYIKTYLPVTEAGGTENETNRESEHWKQINEAYGNIFKQNSSSSEDTQKK
jgi:Zn-dependent protease/tetratricopeptide (TPR) repeat protein